MTLRNDYSDDFDPALNPADFSRQTLAHLAREFLLNGHLQDRVGLPLVAMRFASDPHSWFATLDAGGILRSTPSRLRSNPMPAVGRWLRPRAKHWPGTW